MNRKMDYNGLLFRFLPHFIYAGSSALILSVAFTLADFRFIYIFALLPFLHGVIRTDLKGSIACGLFLTISIAFVTFSNETVSALSKFVSNILFLCFVFTAFSVVLNRLKRYFALSFLLFVALSLSLGYFHKSYLEFNIVFEALRNDAGFVFRATSLLGFLFISFLVIAVNSLLFMLIGILRRNVVSRRFYFMIRKSRFYFGINDKALLRHQECLPSLRAPPVYL